MITCLWRNGGMSQWCVCWSYPLPLVFAWSRWKIWKSLCIFHAPFLQRLALYASFANILIALNGGEKRARLNVINEGCVGEAAIPRMVLLFTLAKRGRKSGFTLKLKAHHETGSLCLPLPKTGAHFSPSLSLSCTESHAPSPSSVPLSLTATTHPSLRLSLPLVSLSFTL